MGTRLGLGIVGAGSIGIRGALDHFVLEDVQDRTHLAAVCDPVPGRAAAAAAKYGVARAYESYDELLADPDVDAVILASPIGLHYEQGLAAIRAGKHVHFNKTMTTSAAEATHLIEEAAQRGIRLVASPGQMIQPQNGVVRKLLHEGAIGKLGWAVVGAGFGAYHEEEGVRGGDDVLSNVNPSWYWRKPGGGPLWDMTVYGLHTLTGILGPAKRVTAMSGIVVPERSFRGETYTVDADDNTLGIVDFGGSVFAYVFGAVAGGLNPKWGQPDFYGTAGVIRGLELNGRPIDYPGRDGSDMYNYGRHILGAHRNMGEAHVFEDSMQLVDWVLNGVPAVGSAEHARHVIEIFEAMYTAAETGQTQTLTTTFDDSVYDQD